ncbi:hypothetical protein GGI35DRAFT_472408 [Trichoderma velutinum]
MVEVAIAGGSGRRLSPNLVTREVIDAILESKDHEIPILSRSTVPTMTLTSNLEWQIVDYNDVKSLTRALNGTHTLLSFIQTLRDFKQNVQRNLIDAAIEAGVKRFSPSEYGSKDTIDMSWSGQKEIIREYLREINKPEINKRGIVVEGHEDAIMNLTSVADFAAIVARAVDYEGGKWPTIGGIRGSRLTFTQIFAIGDIADWYFPNFSITKQPFAIEKVKIEDLEAGKLKTAWNIEATHQAALKEGLVDMHKAVTVGILLSCPKGAWDSSDEMNWLFPDFEFTNATEFLAKV